MCKCVSKSFFELSECMFDALLILILISIFIFFLEIHPSEFIVSGENRSIKSKIWMMQI